MKFFVDWNLTHNPPSVRQTALSTKLQPRILTYGYIIFHNFDHTCGGWEGGGGGPRLHHCGDLNDKCCLSLRLRSHFHGGILRH